MFDRKNNECQIKCLTLNLRYVILYKCEKAHTGDFDMAIDRRNSIENIELQSLLFDFYGKLLNSSQNEVMALYHEDNLSLSEIAEELGISRQAVHYTLRKAEETLRGYEDKLGLVSEYSRNLELADKA